MIRTVSPALTAKAVRPLGSSTSSRCAVPAIVSAVIVSLLEPTVASPRPTRPRSRQPVGELRERAELAVHLLRAGHDQPLTVDPRDRNAQALTRHDVVE